MVAQQLGRKWIGIDIEQQAAAVLIERLEKDGNMEDSLAFTKLGVDFIHRLDIPERTDIPVIAIGEVLVKEKAIYRTKGLLQCLRGYHAYY